MGSVACPMCDGTGVLYTDSGDRTENDGIIWWEDTCSHCRGSGMLHELILPDLKEE